MGGLPGDVSEEPVMSEKWKKGWRMSCDVGEATEGLENEQSSWIDLAEDRDRWRAHVRAAVNLRVP